MANTYPQLGRYTVVPAADLASVTAAINVALGDTRKGGDSVGKKAGFEVLSDIGDGSYKKYIALGSLTTSKWQLVDGSAQVTPS